MAELTNIKIRRVSYGRLRSFGNYENEQVSAEAEVLDGASPEATLTSLRAWVAGQLGDDEERANLSEAVNELRWRKDQMERDVARVEDRWKAIIAFLDKLGVELPANLPDTLDELPF